jgi:hypothetical protein
MYGNGGTLAVSSGTIYLVFNNYMGGARMTVAAGATAYIFLPDGTINAVTGGIGVLSGAMLTIEGGEGGTGSLTANANAAFNAGIGGHTNSHGVVNIFGGAVTASGYINGAEGGGAGIGGGYYGVVSAVNMAAVTIGGNATVKATGGSGGAGIGGGYYGANAAIKIKDNAVVYAYGTSGGAGIGTGRFGSFNNAVRTTTIEITDSARVYAQGGNNDAAAIGSGYNSSNSERLYLTVTIERNWRSFSQDTWRSRSCITP